MAVSNLITTAHRDGVTARCVDVVPYKHASSGIQTNGALIEHLLEFEARSDPLGHHGRVH